MDKNKVSRLTIKIRLGIIVGIFTIGFTLFGIAIMQAMNTLNVNGPIYQRIVQGKDLIADILPPPEYILESYSSHIAISEFERFSRNANINKTL